MAVLAPAVTEFDTGAGTTMTEFFSLLAAHYSGGGGTYFSYLGGGVSGADGFALTCDLAVEDFTLIFRRLDNVQTTCSIDPIGSSVAPNNVTSAGDTVTPPTLTSAVEWSGEAVTWDLTAASISTKMTLIEVPDALFVIHSDPAFGFTPRGMHIGKVCTPMSVPTASTKRDGLGLLGYQPDWNSNANDFFSNTAVSTNSFLRGDVSSWYGAQISFEQTSSTLGTVNTNKLLFPNLASLQNTDTTVDAGIYLTKYCINAGRPTENQVPGVVLDGSSGDGWVYVKDTLTSDNHVIPWDRALTPHWG